MDFHKIVTAFFLCIAVSVCFAQDSKFYLSAPIDLEQRGWNKVLYMKNGNTMLFNFDRNKSAIVKVFDSSHKQAASKECSFRILDITRFETLIFKGMFEINGEAVLFFDEERMSKRGLVRLRFNSKQGTLVEEKLMAEAYSLAKPMDFYIMKNKEDDDYAILYSTEVSQLKECNLHVTYYNNLHESTGDVPIEVDRKKYDYLYVVGAESQPNGNCIMLNLTILQDNQTLSAESRQRAVYDHHFALYYIPKGSSKAQKTVVDLSTDVYPNYTKYTYNPFAQTVNALLYSYRPIWYKFGIDIERGSASDNLFFKYDPAAGDIKLNYIKYRLANTHLQEKTDTSKFYYGMPLQMFTNENGLSTIVSETYERYDEPETEERYNLYTYLGNIGITLVDDDGKEIWGTVLPHSERMKSYKRFYNPVEFARKTFTGYPFGHLSSQGYHPSYGASEARSYRASTKQSYLNSRSVRENNQSATELPEQVYEHQFLSLNTYYHDKNLYIIYNDYDKNFSNTIGKPSDTVYTYNSTNACYYKMDRKKDITKHYLYGEPKKNEYKCSFIEGADFDDKRGVYVSLVQYKKGEDITLRMAWSYLQ